MSKEGKFWQYGPSTNTLTETQIQKACDWWADALMVNSYDAGMDDPTPMILATLLAAKNPVTVEELIEFKVALRTTLTEAPEEQLFGMARLSCDYNPSRWLAHAADEAGIDHSRFPWKTNMWFGKDGTVTVSAGYGAPSEEI